MSRVTLAAFSTSVLISAMLPQPSFSQTLLGDTKVPIARHEQYRSAVRIAEVGDLGLLYQHPEGISIGTDPSLNPASMLPLCSRASVRRVELSQAPRRGENMDLLFYSENHPSQERAAKKTSSTPIAYTGETAENRRAQHAARNYRELLNIKCLPTRFRLITVNGRRYSEYREGVAAWDDVK